MTLREEADQIIHESIQRVLPDEAIRRALRDAQFGTGQLYLVAAGKAAWQMAATASEILREQLESGIVITKYDHVKGEIKNVRCFEAGHPIPDKNSFKATEEAIELVSDLKAEDTVLFLLSGGGSALFEKPLISGDELQAVTSDLIGSGADIVEINTIRKRLSAVKGGKFAKLCEPAQVYTIVLSDILGDPLDMIASGPAYPDSSTPQDALRIVEKYHLEFSPKVMELLHADTPKQLDNVTTVVTGSVRDLCMAAKGACEKLGYETLYLTDQLACEAREAGSFLGAIARSHQDSQKSLAFIAGGETIVYLRGSGKGGRNQEIALAAADEIAELEDTAVFSVGSDGTDGPTDAAGGYADGDTKQILAEKQISIFDVLAENDAYNALKESGGLVMTGATGTNVNDVAVVLIRR